MFLVFFIANFIILFALVLVIGLWILRSIIRPLTGISRELAVIAGGNLERKIEVRTMPEFAALSDGFNTMVNNIQTMLREADEMSEVIKRHNTK